MFLIIEQSETEKELLKYWICAYVYAIFFYNKLISIGYCFSASFSVFA